MRTSWGLDRARVGDSDLVYGPQLYVPQTLTGVIFCHASGHTAATMISPNGGRPNAWALMRAIAAKFPLIVSDQALDNWGNDTGITALTGCRTFLQGASSPVRAKSGKVLLVGVSMGFQLACAWARANPTLVAAIAGILPLNNVNDLYTRNWNGATAAIDTAYGKRVDAACATTNGSPTVTDALCVAGDVGKAVVGTGIPVGTTIQSVNAGVNFTMTQNATATQPVVSLTLGGWVQGVLGPTKDPTVFASQLTMPIKMFYGNDDPGVLPSTVTSFLSLIPNGSGVNLGNIGGHDTEAAYPPTLSNGLMDFLLANAA